MLKTSFFDLPDLVLLDIIHYLSPFDAIQAFYDIDDRTDRIINLLIESQCFKTIHQLRLPLFNFVCRDVVPRLNVNLFHMTLYNHQLEIARNNEILSYLPNLSSLHLINIIENEGLLSYFLHPQLTNLTIEFLSEHHTEAQTFTCEQFIFDKISKKLLDCHLKNQSGIRLQRLTLFPNDSLQRLTIQLKELSDLHILFEQIPNIRSLNVELCQWTIETIKYDYKKLSQTLPNLTEFSLETNHTLTFNQLLLLIENFIYLEKLSIIYRNYDGYGIDTVHFEFVLSRLSRLIDLDLFIKFIYFNLDARCTFEQNHQFKQRWRIHTHANTTQKSYLAYTKPFRKSTYSTSTDILFQDESNVFPTVTKLSLRTHTKQENVLSLIRSINHQFPSLTQLHIVDPFGMEHNQEECSMKLSNISSFDASDLKIPNFFQSVYQSLPNLNHLHVNCDILTKCNLDSLFENNQIKYLQLLTTNLDEISHFLFHFSNLKQLTVNINNSSQRKSHRSLFQWFDISPHLYIVHVRAPKLSDIFYLRLIENEDKFYLQHCNEILTLWK
ncbi:unnamed protein product [Adineta ricciae]|uniref:F-box domain-containing protein n=1 Tax=Adineta ricciae TaxID=249248 RepID=A0A815BRF2_ADIRI|nr:unnamed protein product [Adineta ricciae]CAF1630342.1 unnamed protein product [Adineta ricciae]